MDGIIVFESIDLLLSVFDEALYRSLITSNTIGRALLICSYVNHFNQLPSINFHVNRSELFRVVCMYVEKINYNELFLFSFFFFIFFFDVNYTNRTRKR